MGTVMNGNVWSGACVNGKVVSGLAKNGVVFYRKPVSTYKRRIIVGDSLGGKDIYNDFPTGYYSTFPTGTNSFTTLVESNGAPLIYENVINSPQDIEISSDEMVSGYSPYHYVDGEETISEKMTIDDYDTFDVTNITDNASYRHLFIEDEYIRPLKVGDVITRNTKFYFTIPDDIFLKTNIGTNPIRIDRGSLLSVIDYSSPKRIMFYVNNYISTDNYVVLSENEEIQKNKSSMIVSPVNGNYFEGTVSAIESNSLIYNMIFVDTRTLG